MADVTLPQHEITGSGEMTVFLLHGAYGDGRYFANTRDFLADQGYRVVVWDCPGYRESPQPYGSSIEAHGRAAADLVRATGTATNVVLGHSMGGLIAPEAARLAPELIHGVILSSTSRGSPNRTPEERERFIAERLDPIEQGQSVAEYAPGLLTKMMGPGAGGPLVDRVVDVVREMSTDVFVSSMYALIERDGTPALRQLRIPALLLAGENDPACPVDGMREMEQVIADAELHVIAGVGHYSFAEAPDAYHDHLVSFLRKRFPDRHFRIA